MSSFVEFAKELVRRQIAYYEGQGGEYNEDPFSVRYKTRMTVNEIFGLTEATNHTESCKSLAASLRLEELARAFQESLASREERQRALFYKHRNALSRKQHELTEIRAAEESEDPLLSILSNEPAVKKALLRYRRHGLDNLRFVCKASVLAVVDPNSKRFFFPRRLPTEAVRIDPSLYRSGDATGCIEQDCDGSGRACVPDDLRITTQKEPVWFAALHKFYPRQLLQNTPWGCFDRDEWSRFSPDPGHELVRAMVVTSQVAAFLKRDDRLSVESYRSLDELYATFHQHVKTQFVDPALEAMRQRFQTTDWSDVCALAVQNLPVFQPLEQNDDTDEDDGVECIMTGRRSDLIRVTIVRCPVLDWDGTRSFEDHFSSFSTRYAHGQQRWWHAVTHSTLSSQKGRRHGSRRRRFSSCSSTSSSRSVLSTAVGSNSRHRGRKNVVLAFNRDDNDDDDDDFDGFLVGPWTNCLILHRNLADLLQQAWRLTHLQTWIAAVFLMWKRDKSPFDFTSDEIIWQATNAIVSAMQKCRTPSGSW